jgi:hypothetical protein
MEECCKIDWFGVRADGYKVGRYWDPDEPDQPFDVEVAVPGLAGHRFASVSINGADMGGRSNLQAAMVYAEWVLRHRRRGDFRQRIREKSPAA